MLTYNIQAQNGNFYRGHKPSNHFGNCWASVHDRDHALVFTIAQARDIITCKSVVCRDANIVISIKYNPISDDECNREIFCLSGGYYYDWKKGV